MTGAGAKGAAMNTNHLLAERLVALFLLGVLLLNPPLLTIFDEPVLVAGVPALYLYLFAAWALLIVLLALVAEFSPPATENYPPADDHTQNSASGDPEGA